MKKKRPIEASRRSALVKTASSALAAPATPTKQPGIRKTGPSSLEITTTKSLEELLPDLCSLTGTRSPEVAIRVVEQTRKSLVGARPEGLDQGLAQAIKTIAELGPQNATEAMLAAQMIATNDDALFFMANATRDDQTFEGRDANVSRATRLMRLHLEQIEAMQKLKGKAGQQKVTVEHVHVYQGGQAIVGAVGTGKPDPRGGGSEASLHKHPMKSGADWLKSAMDPRTARGSR